MGENNSIKKVFVISASGEHIELQNISDIQTLSELNSDTDEVNKYDFCKEYDLQIQITDKKVIEKIKKLCKRSVLESLLMKLQLRRMKKILHTLADEK